MNKAIHPTIALLFAILLLPCSPRVEASVTNDAKRTYASVPAPKGSNYLHKALLKETDVDKIKDLLRAANARTLNKANDLGHTPMHYIYAAHAKDVLLLAWDQGGNNRVRTKKGETPWDWRERLHSSVLEVKKEKLELQRESQSRVVFDNSPLRHSQYSYWSEKLPNYNFLPEPENSVPQSGDRQYLSNIRKRYENMATSYLRLADMQTSIPLVAEPDIPPALELVQDEFEVDSDFQERLELAIAKRNQKIVALQADYQDRVEYRNKQIDQLEAEQSKRRKELDEQKVYFLGDALRKELDGFKIEYSHFEQSAQKIYYKLISSNSDYEQLVAIDANAGGKGSAEKNRRLAEQADKINPSVTFRIDGDELQLYRVHLQDSPGSNVLANNASSSVVEATPASSQAAGLPSQAKRVLVGNRTFADEAFAQVASLQKQNPNIVDEFRTTVITLKDGTQEFRDTGLQEDELWERVQELRSSRLDKNAYIFAIGIEDYVNEADVPYATNSAELTTELFRLKAGVPKDNTILLTGRDTTGTSIEGKFRTLLGILEANRDSTLYFYYAGHGLPTDNAVYILPSDAVTGSYIDDDFNLDGMLQKIAKTNVKHSYVFLDTCFSGKTDLDTLAFKGVGAVALNPKKPKLADNFTVFYGGQASQFANAYNDKRHRMMSYYLTEGVLDGKDTTILELANYVSGEVRRTSARLGPDHKQEPYVEGNTKIELF